MLRSAASDDGPLTRFAAWLADGPGLDAATMAEARLGLLDTLGCVASGAGTPLAEKLRAALPRGGDRSGFGLAHAGPGDAAMYFAAAAHAEDFDDSELIGSAHPSAVVLGALMALAGAHTRADDFLGAYAAGVEGIAQLGSALGYGHYRLGWHATGTLGPVGAAAAAASLLRLDAGQASAALSLASSRAGGLKSQFGSDAKPMQAGFAAKAGVEAALLARSGVTGAGDVWAGRNALIDLYGATDSPGFPGELVLHRPLATGQIARKRFPSCAYTHRAIAAALELDLPASEIASGEIDMPAPFAAVAGNCNPRSAAEARFSTTWCVACALENRGVTTDSFGDAMLDRIDLRGLEARLSCRPRQVPAGITDLSADYPDRVTVTLTDGTIRSAEVAEVPGGPGDPMNACEIEAKVSACFASFGLSDAAASALSGAVLDAPATMPLAEWLGGELILFCNS
ncbi:MAG: MmgE/PrpD family protein [Pseudomonadota bacterium]